MKFSFIAFFFVLINASVTYPQKNFHIENAETLKLNFLSGLSTVSASIPFKEIIVKDYRFDTTKIGYITNGEINKIVLQGNSSFYFTKILNEYFQNNLNSSSDKSLLIILKTLWLQKGGSEYLKNRSIVTKSTLASTDDGLYFAELETFALTNNNYKALTKLDNIFLIDFYKPKKIKNFILQPFDSLIKKISEINVEPFLSKKRNITWNEIHAAYSKRFDLPILNQETSQKGIFLTFDDFKNNLTTHADFFIIETELSDDVYIGKGRSEKLLTDYWGFYDGYDYYIRIRIQSFQIAPTE